MDDPEYMDNPWECQYCHKNSCECVKRCMICDCNIDPNLDKWEHWENECCPDCDTGFEEGSHQLDE